MSCLNCGHQIPEDARFCERCGAPQTGRSRDGGLAVVKSSALASNRYVHALRRFWWVLVLGLGIAALAAIASVYRINFLSMPPSLEKRAQVTYTSSARLLVTSAEAPYYRTTVTRDVTVADGTTQGYPGAPDIGTLISAANLYPVLIESDEVAELRQEMFGFIPGSVTTRAIYEVNSPSRFELSQVPVVEVYGFSNTYAGAVEITRATVEAFKAYIDQTQDDASLSRDERILLQDIQQAEDAVASGGTSLSLPLMLFVVIAAAFFALAVLLDRIIPAGFGLRRRRAAHKPPEEIHFGEPEPERPAGRSEARV